LWWHPHPDQAALWESWIQLGEKFYSAVIASPVPVDMRALRALKRSPLALDLYARSLTSAFVIVQKTCPAIHFLGAVAQPAWHDYGDIRTSKRKLTRAPQDCDGVPRPHHHEGQGGLCHHAQPPCCYLNKHSEQQG